MNSALGEIAGRFGSGVIFLVLASTASAQNTDKLGWSVTPYIWAPQTSVDLTYLDTSDTTERTVFTIDAENKQLFLDAAVAYWPAGVGSSFSLFGGMR